MNEVVERVARAIEGAEIGYQLRLTRMDENGSIYTLTYDDGETLTFDGTDTAYQHIGNKKRLKSARAAMEAMQEPTRAMLDQAMGIVPCGDAETVWRAMIAESLR